MKLWGRGRGTLFAQVFGLVLAAVVGAEAVNLWIVFNLPPPPPNFYTEAEIMRGLRGQAPAANRPDRNNPPLVIHRELQKPETDRESRMGFLGFRRLMAEDLGLSQDDILVITEGGPSDRRGYRIVRDRLGDGGQPREESFLIAPFKVAIHQKTGQWLTVQTGGRKGLAFWQQRLLLWFAVSVVALIPVAYLFSRVLAKPLGQFAAAAERFGRDPRAPPMAVKGSSEITKAAAAFNEMQDRLRRYVDDRTSMVAAIAHDLRTPLTRLRFRIEAAPEEAQAKMTGDIDQMEAMIAATLTFVRDAQADPQRTRLELSSLLESVVDDMAETGADVQVARAEKVVVEADSLALRRLLTNLIENAIKYGARARCTLSVHDRLAEIDIEDEGPGVPKAELNRVFDPFYRREPSRNRQTGGIGLGLSVARSIARAHGGDVDLQNRPQGGLRAKVTLPI
ncbi:MAG TPA: ATP-binding protein [Caulobacteraceae bacterium]|jgi:signal transduction histidine kinase